jgi:hypothetical protein
MGRLVDKNSIKSYEDIYSFDLKVIERYGTLENALGGAIKIFVGKRERQEIIGYLKYMIQLIEKTHGTIIESGGRALTVYK